jgi:anaerobic selenocysteine-containing dehydrogenase
MDGNTRLCTATAAASLKASFGTDGQPGSYTDVDHCDALAIWGHNVAETQTVLWMRMLDRRAGADPPRLLCVDPRLTPVAREADVHLAPRNGTNVALMNGILREVIARGWTDDDSIARSTLGFKELGRTVEPWTPARVADVCGVAARDVEAAAELVGTCRALLSTVLQGFYQSNQATAAACQVNNLHLLRGMLGRPGAGLYQMNGQPTAQNNRETGADGDLQGFRNWYNEDHVAELAELWNVDRTVHLSEQAVEPPGQARADLDIFLDYARRMDFRDKDGAPLIPWTDAEGAFEAWKACSRGRPCDYSGMSYAKLRRGPVQWPCTAEAPDGTERLYVDGRFNTDPATSESYGLDLSTGAAFTKDEYTAKQPGGRAFLHPADHDPSPEVPSDEYPLLLSTGRTVFHFHTRTKTGRAPELQAAAPDVWVELSARDARDLGVGEGALVRVESPRGAITGRVRVSGIREGAVFVPFHYGWWDRPDLEGAARAANELTITAWDPVSKQPIFKVAAVRVVKLDAGDGSLSPAPTVGAPAPVKA